MNRIDLDPQGVVVVLKNATLFTIATSSESDAANLQAAIMLYGKNVSVQSGPYPLATHIMVGMPPVSRSHNPYGPSLP